MLDTNSQNASLGLAGLSPSVGMKKIGKLFVLESSVKDELPV